MIRRSDTLESETSDVAATNDANDDVKTDENVEAESAPSKSRGNVSQHDLSATLYGTPEQQKAEEGHDDSKGGKMPNFLWRTRNNYTGGAVS